MRINVKGGIWTNVEDEILKVAVMKYGKNQWARISSLLVRKTPKQCKARWMEWLDPSIRKTEWSKEEEEKLLHLAKLMPTQWRTIAPLIGRTAAQCLEHYEKLLEAARKGEEAGDEGVPSLEEARRLKPGEIDPAPETKAARPDPVDMDEDEKEMLSEARARLANTQGKKAKRKAREKLLDEARRMAALQKRREMRAAGLMGPVGMKIKGLNYNVEIPFERAPVPGFHDTTAELGKGPRAAPVNDGNQLPKKRSHNPTRDAIEIAARRRDAQKDKARQEQGYLSAALERKLLEQQTQRRQAMHLPAPQVSQEELEALIKAGHVSEAAQIEAMQSETAGSTSLRPSATPSATPLHTLRGGSASTPYGRMTPGTPRSSPYRDQLNINAGETLVMDPTALRDRLRSGLKSLPKPKNDYELALPELGNDNE
jgi:pre-mRNA-splicing factor CDC5/CEF1